MLLNEFLREHRKVEKLEATVEGLAATVKEQAAQIQKVSAQLERANLRRKWSKIPEAAVSHNQPSRPPHRVAAFC